MAIVAAAVLAGCGSSGSARAHRGRTASGPRTPQAGVIAPPAAVAVIRAWSDALRRGDVRGAAAYFAIPSLMVNGAGVGGVEVVNEIHNRAQAVAANASLPCGAVLLSTAQRGRYVNALFRLTDRPGQGGGCGAGVGQTARTNFVIVAGRIAEWIRAPSAPGGGGGSQPGAPPAPQTEPPAPQTAPPSV